MAEESKTYLFAPESKSMDPSTLLAMMNNGGGFGNNMSWIWVIFLFFLYGWRGNGLFGNNGSNGVQNALGRDFDTTTLLNAINGNANAISNLSTQLNCSVGQIRSAVDAINGSISTVGNQIGMSGMQVINAIQSGNQQLASQLATCCCENKQLVITQGYENQIATLNQTNQLSNKLDSNTASITSAINQQTVEMNNLFCALKERELQNKIDSLTAANTALQNSISNANQTAQIQSYITSSVNPLVAEIASIKSKLPETVTLPYSCATAVPTALVNQYGINNGLWG